MKGINRSETSRLTGILERLFLGLSSWRAELYPVDQSSSTIAA